MKKTNEELMSKALEIVAQKESVSVAVAKSVLAAKCKIGPGMIERMCRGVSAPSLDGQKRLLNVITKLGIDTTREELFPGAKKSA